MDKELKLIAKSPEIFPETVDTRTPLEIMESDKQLFRMYEFFEEQLEKGEYERARKVAWTLFFQWGLEVDGLR